MNKHPFPDDPSFEDDEEKSKSQIKREMHALLALGTELVNLPKEQFAKIELPENVYDAILEARRIQQHGAHKRQLQYIGKLMRSVDAAHIREQIDTLEGHSKQAANALHHIERWRDRLLDEGDAALELLLEEYPLADRQYLRQSIRNAKKEILANKPPKTARGLFKYLRELLGEND
jgi:ribosome-associated protein